MDLAVMRALGARSIRVGELIGRVRATDHLERLGGALSGRGLLLTPEEAARARRRSVLPLYLVLAVGVVRFLVGATNGFPVGYLAIELFATIVLLVVLSRWPIRPRTVHGDRVLDAARHAATSGLDLVAIDGLGAYPDETVRGGLVNGAPDRRRAPSSWVYGSYTGGVYAACGTSVSHGSGGDSGGGGGASCGGGGGCGGGAG